MVYLTTSGGQEADSRVIYWAPRHGLQCSRDRGAAARERRVEHRGQVGGKHHLVFTRWARGQTSEGRRRGRRCEDERRGTRKRLDGLGAHGGAGLSEGLGLISPCFIVNELRAVVCLYNQGEGAELLRCQK